jgi:outer membrane protein TolC
MSRRTIRGAFVAGVALLLMLPATRAGAPAVNRAKSAKVQQLQEERIATLRKVVAIAANSYVSGLLSQTDVVQANQALVDAELDAADSNARRIEILEAAIANAKQREELIDQRYRTGQCSSLDPLLAKDLRLKMEIALVKEQEAAK